MRSAVTPEPSPPSAGSTPSAASIFARRVRGLRIALALVLVLALPLAVGVAAHQGGGNDALHAGAGDVARSAARTPRDLDRVRRGNPDVSALAVYRLSRGRLREIESSG